MPPFTPTADALLRFNHALLSQALALAAQHEAPGAPPYQRPVGAHLRHVIEHHEALLLPGRGRVVDYDARPRDTLLECCPQLARRRLLALQRQLGTADLDLEAPLAVRGLAGLAGEFAFEVESSLGRELAFVASHAVHHFAQLVPYLRQHGLPIPEGLGLAPATVAHARRTEQPVQETA